MQLGPRSSGIYSQKFGDFIVLVAFHVVQDKNLSRPRREQTHRSFDGHPQIWMPGFGCHRIKRELVIGQAGPVPSVV